MRPDTQVHDALARLLEYPRESWFDRVEEAAHVVAAGCPRAWEPLSRFIGFARVTPQGELEELFTRTFDNTDQRALEVGWHVFGENYTRGTFMAAVRRDLREAGVAENGELPDHLSHLLPLLARLPESKAAELAVDTVAPAVRKVQLALAGQENPWTPVLDAVLEVLVLHDERARTAPIAQAPKAPDPDRCDSMPENGDE